MALLGKSLWIAFISKEDAKTSLECVTLSQAWALVNHFAKPMEEYIRAYAGDKLDEWKIKSLSEDVVSSLNLEDKRQMHKSPQYWAKKFVDSYLNKKWRIELKNGVKADRCHMASSKRPKRSNPRSMYCKRRSVSRVY